MFYYYYSLSTITDVGYQKIGYTTNLTSCFEEFQTHNLEMIKVNWFIKILTTIKVKDFIEFNKTVNEMTEPWKVPLLLGSSEFYQNDPTVLKIIEGYLSDCNATYELHTVNIEHNVSKYNILKNLKVDNAKIFCELYNREYITHKKFTEEMSKFFNVKK